ncbi:MAG TPA: hypothetical protein VGR88_01105 [Ktedonobacterales bacterium]|nr:hypothetical protein [Ktedonobacterales bacterium]
MFMVVYPFERGSRLCDGQVLFAIGERLLAVLTQVSVFGVIFERVTRDYGGGLNGYHLLAA